MVDNTFATPYLQQPLALGADVVVHSTTKYLGGHSDVVGGAVLTDDVELAERLAFLQNAMGAVPGPWDAWLVLRGLKTLAVRMQAPLRERPCDRRRCSRRTRRSREVRWPGLPSHPGHAVAAQQMRDFGGMVVVPHGLGGGARWRPAPASGSSRWPSRSAASSRWSSTRRA